MHRLRDRLGLIVASVAAGSCGEGGSSGSTEPECPHTVVLRQFDVDLGAAQACELVSSSSYQIYAQGQQGGTAEACQARCSDAKVNACRLPSDYETRYMTEKIEAGAAAVDADPDAGAPVVCSGWTSPATVVLTCSETEARGTWHQGCPVEGRRPDGLCEGRVAEGASVLGRYFATCAHLEAAAVVAFRALSVELARHGAPAELLAELADAARDEVRHAEIVGALAARFGARVPPVEVAAREPRSLEGIAHENVVEGVVRETFGAAMALFRATRAGDDEVRRALLEVAVDECLHAELSWKLAEWLSDELDPDARARLDAAMRLAVAELRRDTVSEPERELREVAGLPSARECRALIDGLERDVWFGSRSVAA